MTGGGDPADCAPAAFFSARRGVRPACDTPAIWIAFVSFIMSSMAATLGPIPLGLGTFEAACVGMLSLLGVAIEAALAATLLLRGLTLATHGARSLACQT